MRIESSSEQQTISFGSNLAKLLAPGDIVCLHGELGSGKTTLVKGLAEGAAIDPKKVNSPTFVLMNIYEGTLPVYHFDLYRLDEMTDFGGIGYEEFLYGEGLAVIEWAEKLKDLMPEECLDITLDHQTDDHRTITLKAKGNRYQEIVQKLSDQL